MAEAGVTGSEVIEGEARSLVLQLVGDAAGVFGVADQGALCDLEDEAIQWKVCISGSGEDVPGEREIGELGEGDVNGEGEVAWDIPGCGEDSAEELAGEQTVKAGSFSEREIGRASCRERVCLAV